MAIEYTEEKRFTVEQVEALFNQEVGKLGDMGISYIV